MARKAEQRGHGAGFAPPIVHEVLQGLGRPLDAGLRGFMESRFNRDFSAVRVHSGARAAESASSVGAVAYTVGQDIVLGPGRRDFAGEAGRALLAHELHHTTQQKGATTNLSAPIAIEAADSPHEREAESASSAGLNGHLAAPASARGVALARLTPEKFREKLGSTPNQKTTITTLFSNATFMGLWNYLKTCPAAPKADLGPLALEVTPGLKIGGVERFGGYSPLARQLEINPTKPEHVSNPQELIDTITHELIHAVSDLEGDCAKAGAGASPLGGAATDSGPSLASVKGTPDEDKFLKELGPGASNPCEEFIDINSKAQQIIVAVIESNMKSTKIGRPTLTFVNDALRKSPAALSEYKICRDAACADPDKDKRQTKIGACGDAIIAKFVPPPPKAQVAPPKKPKKGNP
ncbi:MAG TPA: DUF4157 domain-containing protein [Allosphingosinicella sp.]|nr:DUF4157 domain-containing protein [Allosphingosinicella sp.]